MSTILLGNDGNPISNLPFGLPFPNPVFNATPAKTSDDERISQETWRALVRWTQVFLAILVVVLALEKIPRVGVPLLIILVLGMLLTATNKGII